jgi:hypothetical protein
VCEFWTACKLQRRGTEFVLGNNSDSHSCQNFIASVRYGSVHHPTRPSLLADLNLLSEDLSLGRTQEIVKQSCQIKFTECILPFDPESVVSLLDIRKRKDYIYGTAILMSMLICLLTAIGLTPGGSSTVQYTFTH